MKDEEKAKGWIKLEIPKAVYHSNRMNTIIECHTKKLVPILSKFGITVVDEGDMNVVEEQDCEPYYEINYEVERESFDHNLVVAIQEYFDSVLKDGMNPFERGNLVLQGIDFWKRDLICFTEVVLSAFYFGNIQGGSFINHWEVSFSDDEIGHRDNSGDPDPINRINGLFEFDKADILTVHFKQKEFNDWKGNREEVLMFYQIMLKKSSIRRVIMDPGVSDPYESKRHRIHFETNHPVFIRRGYFTEKQQGAQRHDYPVYTRRLTINRGRNNNQYPNALAITDSPVFTIEFSPVTDLLLIYNILSRIRFRTGINIEFATMTSIDCLFWRENPYHRWIPADIKSPTDLSAPIYKDFCEAAFRGDSDREFEITYLIECLISRGAVVKDQLLLDVKIWFKFLEIVLHYFKQDDKLCEASLEDLIHMIDGRKRIGNIIKCFDRICQTRQKNSLVNGLTNEEIREGYQRVRKLVLTPTRVIYVAPETIMGNRVLRKFDPTGSKVIRVTFRDDDNTQMRLNRTSKKLLENTVENYMKNGVTVAGKDFGYLGSSNSQMRDNGAYFMVKYSKLDLKIYMERHHGEKPPPSFIPKIKKIRTQLGKFEMSDNIPKLMARLGQCFTQSRLSGVPLMRSSYITGFDYVGGKGEYTFSDGIGMMSQAFAEKVSMYLDFGKGRPSCFQFRFRGMKGVIAMNPVLDIIRKWDKCNLREKYIGDNQTWDISCIFRPSQNKFISKRREEDQIEIVKFSSPVPVALNRPFINILDQVSEMQSKACHERITNRIEELLDRQIYLLGQQMVNESYCRERLKELPKRVDIDFLKRSWGFTLCNEPFFRSLIKATIRHSISKQLRKLQIPIPTELGRSMLGVIDETGILQYGQIFVQYTKNISVKLPAPTAAKVVLTGPVLLTKNPCIVSGDVRVFEAIDIPQLHHMCDVVVFPQHGPRPHPDEMAGSDLDGDEYSVIWDSQLLFDYNEPAFDFTAEKKKEEFDKSRIDELMRAFYIKYLTLDAVGTISNNHLHCSDQFGLNAKVCMDLAKKNCQAVDFTKSGEAPEPLETKWREDKETKEIIPPERVERVPDYHMGNDYCPVYLSPRLCGRLFRDFKCIEDVIKLSDEKDDYIELEIDRMIYHDGYEEYKSSAIELNARYNAQLRSIMENYGIRTEGEIFSGFIVEMRNRISDKDQDDMSFFNTNQMLDTKVTVLFAKYREFFFEEFGGYMKHTEPFPKANNENSVLQRVCKRPTEQMMKKAVAWYIACYEEARKSRENKKLSFAWTVYDIIADVRRVQQLHGDISDFSISSPLEENMTKHRDVYIGLNMEKFEKFLTPPKCVLNAHKKAFSVIKLYTSKYTGLKDVLFIIDEWSNAVELDSLTPFNSQYLSLLFILFATRTFPSNDDYSDSFIELIEMSDEESRNSVVELSETRQSIMTLKFFEFLASRRFKKLSIIDFSVLHLSAFFSEGQWIPLHEAAISTYYNLMFNLRFDELPIDTRTPVISKANIRENEPFVIELPNGTDLKLIKEKLEDYTGISQVMFRRVDKNTCDVEEKVATVRYLVSSLGTVEATHKLRKLVAVKIPLGTRLNGKELSLQLAQLCAEKILNGIF